MTHPQASAGIFLPSLKVKVIGLDILSIIVSDGVQESDQVRESSVPSGQWIEPVAVAWGDMKLRHSNLHLDTPPPQSTSIPRDHILYPLSSF